MTPDGPFSVTADLALSVDGHDARLTGSGADLTLDSTDPVALWRSAASVPWPVGITVSTGPRGLGGLGDALAEAGLHLDVTGPHGRVAELGRGVDSTLGRSVTGSRLVRFGSPRTLAATVSSEPVPWRPIIGGLALLVLGRWALRRR